MSDLERSRYANESKRTRMNWKTLPFFGRPRQLYPMRCYFVLSQFSPENANRLPTDAFFFIRGLFVCTSFCPFLLRKLLSMLRTWNGHHRTKVSALSPTRRDWLARHCILQWLPTRMTHVKVQILQKHRLVNRWRIATRAMILISPINHGTNSGQLR